MSNFPTFYVGTDRCELVTGSDAELVRGSPGWHKRWLDVVRCGAAAKLPTGLRVLRPAPAAAGDTCAGARGV